MSGFKFRMESLLKMRKLKQEMFERKLSKILAELMHYQNQLESIERQLSLHYDQIRSQNAEQEINIDSAIADRRYLNHLHTLRLSHRQMIGKINEDVNLARKQLAEAKKQTDIMKKLKEHMYKKFLAEMNKQEIKENDDIVNARYAAQIQKEKTS